MYTHFFILFYFLPIIIYYVKKRLKLKINIPYREMEGHITQLRNIQKAAEILRHLIRFLYLVKRLESQIKSEDREVAKAALILNEIGSSIFNKKMI